MQTLPAALAPLAAYRQFVTWYAAPDPQKPGKLQKFPCDYRTGYVAGSVNPEVWTDFATAAAHYARYDRGFGAGVGFVFTANDPFYFLDIDKCIAQGAVSPLAHDLMSRLAGAAAEVSVSGTGFHVIGTCVKPLAHGSRNIALGLELYTDKRFVALTGTGAQGSCLAPGGEALDRVISDYFAPQSPTPSGGAWTEGPVPEWSGPIDDAALVQLASRGGAAVAFGGAGRWTFSSLIRGEGVPENERSEADQALASHLAFWTGKDCARMERIMRSSGLARAKWDDPNHSTYLSGTILKACDFVQSVAQGRASGSGAQPVPEATAVPGVSLVQVAQASAGQYVPAHELMSLFAGCFYLTARQEVFVVGLDETLKPSAFDVVYGGHIFLMDYAGTKKTESAFEAFTKNFVERGPVVRDLIFRPNLAPGTIVTQGKHKYVNSYVPYECEAIAGDAGPFVRHLAKLIPDARDRELFTHYIASLVQNPGVKFQWCPVLQGVEGNGKTAIMEALAYCVGEQFTHRPNSTAMVRDGLKFNSWLEGKLFVGIEEFNVAPNRDFLEEFKVTITNERMSKEGKGANQGQMDNRANMLICTNIKDGVPIKRDGRRYGVWYTAQQSEADLARDGMDGDYFPRLWDWLKKEGGLAYVAHWLKTYPLQADMDPAQGLHRAPKTSSTEEALKASQGSIEQEIQDAIEEGRQGFAGGWVSSRALDDLLEKKRMRLALSRRRELMRGLGYDWHPALRDGRVDTVVSPDNGKPKLYVRDGHAALALSRPADVAKAYSAAQVPGVEEEDRGAVVAFRQR